MNPIDAQLDRLFRAARAPGAPAPSAPFGLETRVLAAWRTADRTDPWGPALRRGLIAASALMVLSFWPLLEGNSSTESEYLQQADSILQTGNNP